MNYSFWAGFNAAAALFNIGIGVFSTGGLFYGVLAVSQEG